MIKQRGIAICSFSLIIVLLLGGCWDRHEVNQLGLISGAGFYRTSGQKTEMSVQIILLKGKSGSDKMGGGDGGGGEGPTIVKAGDGQTAAEALSSIQSRFARELFWGHCNVFVIGSSQAREGISDLVSFLRRLPQIRERSFVFISKGDPIAIMEITPRLEKNSADALWDQAKLQTGITLLELSQILNDDDKSAAIPTVEKLESVENPGGKRTIPILSGMAIIKNGKLVGMVSQKTADGIKWIKNDRIRGVITFFSRSSKGLVSIRIIRSRTKLTPLIQNGNWKILIDVFVEGEVIQSTGKAKIDIAAEINELESMMANDIGKRIMEAVNTVMYGMKADIFGFSEQFHRSYPKEWKKAKGRWDEKLIDMKIDKKIKATIVRPGFTR